ncbi:gfo/Idh/MocA family oxidoreductase [Flavobacterium sp. GA093]|uniref:Gfo/Idh/MocA family oxidoreductase n=1 Tax=Flavobacterium hydrocarbonoxydans TaxID=2683249 RepID=A0A6I4NPM3_9FLAO|nr:Gfo/Idh/MocA family oxidoreductase [Flavobacterium hydrocarbonoxydans]MWB96200.1 gfo/Idh/MocA family oxidoreductase [Flavobacterium hydrocarbonoxydans]
MQRKLRMAMIGGGKDAFIGAVHRLALNMDGLIELVAGSFSSNPEKGLESGKTLFLDEERIYPDYKSMLEKEAAMPADKRIDFVSIVTPNFAHFEPAMMALDKGFNVVLEKPITLTLDEAKKIEEKLKTTGLNLMLCHTYTGYPMIKQAKELLANHTLGKIRKIYAEYTQGWLSTFLENTGQTQASWRTNPEKSGKAGCMGDIGTHAFNLAEYITGLEVTQICSTLNTVVEGRMLDDDGAAFLKFNNDATGVLTATQIAAGEENYIRIRVYGEKGGIEWKQDDANSLLVKWLDKPNEIYRTGGAGNGTFASHNTRIPAGHPEGYLEAFANLYRNFALTLDAKINNQNPEKEWLDFPGIKEGIRGMAFIENIVASSESNQKWFDFKI